MRMYNEIMKALKDRYLWQEAVEMFSAQVDPRASSIKDRSILLLDLSILWFYSTLCLAFQLLLTLMAILGWLLHTLVYNPAKRLGQLNRIVWRSRRQLRIRRHLD